MDCTSTRLAYSIAALDPYACKILFLTTMKKPVDTKKLWGGRFKEATAKSVEDFTESISFDARLWPYDIQGSIAHANMLARQGIITKAEASRIVGGLASIAADIDCGKFKFSAKLEDVHMNIESELKRRIGAAGGKLHTARSRNDQVALDIRLYLRHESAELIAALEAMMKVLARTAQAELGTIMPGYTHTQRAQPVLLSHHMLAYVEMFLRDRARLQDALKRINILPLGACALAGTSLPIDRQYVAKVLGFDGVAQNSMDAVSDRDFMVEFIAASSILMMHLSRLSEEMVLWSSEEFGFITLPDAFATGSSIMPQKKNPDVPELVRGKTGRVYGSLIAMLTIMKALPLAYNRDMQEDKPPLFDTVDTVKASLGVMGEMMARVQYNRGRMAETASRGYSTATDIAEYLVRKGMPFRDAHEVTGRIVAYAIESEKELASLTLPEYRKFSKLFKDDVLDCASVEASVNSRSSEGGTSPVSVKARLAEINSMLGINPRARSKK